MRQKKPHKKFLFDVGAVAFGGIFSETGYDTGDKVI